MKLPLTFRVGVDVMVEDWMSVLKSEGPSRAEVRLTRVTAGYGFQSQYPSCFLLEGFLYYFVS